jgi:hypothetical protein
VPRKGHKAGRGPGSLCDFWAGTWLAGLLNRVVLLPILTCRKGTIPSREMACSRRGAPVRLWSPAPQVEKKDPMTMTQGDGQASVPTTRLPFTASPNLE